MNICILIPARNEAHNLPRLLKELKGRRLDVVVVDDGSSDRTAQIAAEHGATVLVNPQNRGKGYSLQRGFEVIVSRGYDALITMDGDGQHAVSDIDRFTGAYMEKKADIICGNRMQDHRGMPLVRWLTNRVMSGLISMVCRQSILDTQCGFRLISTQVLKNIRLSSSAFEIESEVLIKASKKGYRAVSVPVKTIYAGEKSRINPVFDTFRFIAYIIREMLAR
jgi:glycosyltransferase involved in cell wall biosynthesis